MTKPVHLNPIPDESEWEQTISSWGRSLKSRDKSPTTVARYTRAARNLAAFAISKGVESPEDCTPGTIEDYVSYRFDLKPGCAVTMLGDVKVLRLYFARVCDVADIPDPMSKIENPRPKVKPVPLYTDAQLSALLATCSPGKEFVDRRDLAILRLLLDTGVRRDEISKLRLDSFNIARQEVEVVGKGRKIRTVTYGAKTADAIDRYLAARRKHKDAKLPGMWLAGGTRRGEITYRAFEGIIKRRAARAGVDGAFLHRFRHTAADAFLAAGGQEGDAMELFGWESRVMLDRYGREGRRRRALAAQRRLSPGDRV